MKRLMRTRYETYASLKIRMIRGRILALSELVSFTAHIESNNVNKGVVMAQILLIEDRLYQRQLYEEELTDEGYSVISASDGLTGLELFRHHNPKLVIVDILLPDINGIQVMERVLAINPDVPIIVHSAYSSPSHDFVTWFAKAYVTKSSNLDTLKFQVKRCLSGTEPNKGAATA